jgi:hypothetical protein
MLGKRCFAALAAAVLAGPAAAQLSGVFEGEQTAYCIASQAGFDSRLALAGPASVSSSTTVARLSFRPDGTGDATLRLLSIGHASTSPGATPASEVEAPCAFTYSLAPGGLVNVAFATCLATALSGPSAGQVVTESHGRNAQYARTYDSTKLIAVGTRPAVETITNLLAGVTLQRICHRDGVLYFRPQGAR